MVKSTLLFKNKQPVNNVRMWDGEVGDNIFFLPEMENGLYEFINTQTKGFFRQITIPPIISSFLGKRIANQKYFLSIKKQLPNFTYNRLPNKKSTQQTNVFDFTGIMSDILSILKTRSPKLLFDALHDLIQKAVKDYPTGKNYMFIYGDPELDGNESDLLNLIIYINRLYGGKIESTLDGIVYVTKGENRYYPLAIKNEDKLIFQRNILGMVMKERNIQIKDKEFVEEKLNQTKLKIQKLVDQMEESKKKPDLIFDDKEFIQQVKDELANVPIKGTLEEKLNQLFKETPSKGVENLTKTNQMINKKYNGSVEVNIPKGSFDYQKIVGLDELGGYNKQYSELTENTDSLIKELIEGTLTSDKELNIKVLKISSKIIDNNTDRYKEYTVRIQHKDLGNTTQKPYNITFRVPYVVQDKYVKIGGNNYIMINQLFPKPIQKIAPNLVRFYTHYSVCSVTLKNTKLNSDVSYNEIEDGIINILQGSKRIKFDILENDKKQQLSDKYSIDLSNVRFNMEIK